MAGDRTHPPLGMARLQKEKTEKMRLFPILLFLFSIGCSQSSLSQSVYTTKTGEKYHTANCRYLKHYKKEIPLEQAINLGYQACSVCKPETNPGKTQNLVQSDPNTTYHGIVSPKTSATQCTGKTKAGKRCKRMTKNASGRCYQH